MVFRVIWAHARRYFFQAVQLNRRDLLALGIVAEIDELFELEGEAKAAGLGAEEGLSCGERKLSRFGIKMDVEGHEREVLNGMASGFAVQVPEPVVRATNP